MTTFSADLAYLRAHADQLDRQAGEVAALVSAANRIDYGVPTQYLGDVETHRGTAVAMLQHGQQQLEDSAAEVRRYIRALMLADSRYQSIFSVIGLLGLKPGDAWYGDQSIFVTTSAGSAEVEAKILVVDLKAQIGYSITHLPDGTIEVTVYDTDGLGLIAGVGVEAEAGKSMGARAEVGAMLVATSGRTYIVDEGQLHDVLVAEAALRATGQHLVGPRPDSVFTSAGVEGKASVELGMYAKDLHGEMKVVTTTDRKGNVTTQYVAAGGGGLSLMVGGNGAVDATMSITRDRNGKVVSVQTSTSKEVTAGIEGGSESSRPNGGTRTGSMGVSETFRQTVTTTLDVKDNPALAAQINKLAHHEVVNLKDINAAVHHNGVQTTRVEHIATGSASVGGTAGEGVEAGLHVSVSGSSGRTTSVTTSMPGR
jgi:hypothetical protein